MCLPMLCRIEQLNESNNYNSVAEPNYVSHLLVDIYFWFSFTIYQSINYFKFEYSMVNFNVK